MSSLLQEENAVTHILLIDDDPEDCGILKDMLALEDSRGFNVECAASFSDGLSRLARGGFDLVLLDLFLPDSKGLDTFSRLKAAETGLPVVILTGLDDETCALQAVSSGAQDYLVKGRSSSKAMARVIRFAIERHRTQRRHQTVALNDELTGLYNRAGFRTIADQHLKIARRSKHDFFLFLTVLDGLEQIGRQFGPAEAAHALKTTAEILRETFRTSDVIARVGADEFVAFATEHRPQFAETLTSRLRKNRLYQNAQYNRYKLSLSISVVRLSPERLTTTEELDAHIARIFNDYKRRTAATTPELSREKEPL